MSSSNVSNTARKNKNTANIDEASVISYLSNHPDFFRKNPDLLGEISLPHQNSGATSLVERQVAVLRERSIDTRHKLSELLENAKDNDALFTKTQFFVLAILKADSLQAVYDITQHEIQHRFNVESSSIILLTNQPQQWSNKLNAQLIKPLDEAQQQIPSVLNSQSAFCSVLRDSEAAFIFSENQQNIGSTAITTRDISQQPHSPCQLLLCVAHNDPKHYNNDTGTLFLDYIADILQLLTQRFTSHKTNK